MAYANNTDVAPIVSGYFTIGGSGFTNPTTANVDAWCNQYSSRLDAALTAAGYTTVPATGTNDLLLLKSYVAEAVALRTLHAAGMEDTANELAPTVSDFDTVERELALGMTLRLVDQSPRGRIGNLKAKVYGVT